MDASNKRKRRRDQTKERRTRTRKQRRQRSSHRDSSSESRRSGGRSSREKSTRRRHRPNRSRSHDGYRSRSSSYEQRRRSQGVDGRRSRRGRSRRPESSTERHIPPLPGHVSSANVLNNDTQAFLATLVEALTRNRSQSNKFPMLGNVIPDFDPMVKNQTIVMWINKVEECARLYGWGDDQIIHYALPKLSGIAKTWYQALPSMSYSWSEWKDKLEQSFPSSEDYAELLTEMLSKRAKFNDSLEHYYYEKINLLNRCEIYGKRAVDCLLYGIEDRSLRLGAKAAKCQEPEQVLTYFQSIKQNLREPDKSRVNFDKRSNTNPSLSSYSSKPMGTNSETKTSKSNNIASVVCFNCNEPGHFSSRCTKKILKCNVCSKLGHLSINCPRLPSDSVNKIDKPKEKDVMRIETNNTNDSKYLIDLKLNGEVVQGYVDLGSQCTLIRCSEAVKRGITWTVSNLPTMKGIGESIVIPVGVSNVIIEIQGIMEEVNAYIVDDSVIKYSVLIGHSFTEKPGIVITKTTHSLIFTRDRSVKLELNLKTDIVIPSKEMYLLPCFSINKYSGMVHVSGSLRGMSQNEYYLMPGDYEMEKGEVRILVQSFSDSAVCLKRDTLITRVLCTRNNLSINLLDFENAETLAAFNCGQQLSECEINQLKELLKRYQMCFSDNLKDLGLTNVVEMEIKLSDSQPVVYRPYRLSFPERRQVQSMVKEMIEAGIVCESNSPYASPVLLVKKKTGESRLCVDYRALNNKTKKEHYPLPLIDDQLDRLAGNSLFVSLDLASGYYQIPVEANSQDKTAFVTPDGQYQFKRMPFGLTNAPSVFQRAMNKILSKLDYTLVYMDDVLIPSRSFDQGMRRLGEVLQIVKDAGLTLKIKKCSFFCTELEFLGFHVSGEGIRPGKRKTLAIENFPIPRNIHDIRRFIGLTSFFRRFVKNFALIARPLTDLLKSKFAWKWTAEESESFRVLKAKLVERPILALYDPQLETEIHTDASKLGIAGILLQRGTDDLLRPVAYYSRKTTVDEQKFHSFELETLAVVASLNRFRVYLLGLRFKIVTDCNALRTTLTKRDLIPRISRWWIQFQEYDCEIEYRPGSRMAHVDALSRAPVSDVSDVDTEHVFDVLHVDVRDWVATVQGDDSEIKRIKDILEDDQTKFVADVRKNYMIKGGYVYKILDEGLRWLVPKGCRWQVLRMNHDEVGHFGFEKTLSRIRSIFWFPKMRRFTKKYVSACLECAHHKAPGGPKEGVLHPIPKLEKPFHTIHADHLGPFIRSKRGNMYLLVIIDAFTKFINIRAVRDTKTTTAIKVFKEHFSYFGVPSRLITDRGSCFTSAKFKSLMDQLKIKHILNAVATPRANGQVERFNRTIIDALSTKCHDNDNLWDEYVGDVQLGINTTINKTTGKSPSELLFGCRLTNAAENVLSDVIAETTERIDGDALLKLRSNARERIEKQQDYAKKHFDKHRKRRTTYNIGDLVRIERTVIDKDHVGKSHKLIPKFQGPYRILKLLPNDRFLVEDTPLTRKGNKRYENVVALDKIHPWMNFKGYASESTDSDQSEGIEIALDRE